MIKSILVAMDGSPASMTALREAARWAGMVDAELRGIFVEDDARFVFYPTGFSAEGGMPVAAPLNAEDLAAEEAKIAEESKAIRTAFKKEVEGKSFPSTFIQTRGELNTVLVREARAVDLVVIGRRGRNDPSDSTAPGPTTETLIHNGSRPVLVVPERARHNGPALIAYDGGKGIDRVLGAGTELAHAAKAPVLVVSVGDDAAMAAEQEQVLARYLRPHGIEPSLAMVPRSGRTAQTIVDYARKNGVGLIVMGAFGHNPLRELIFGSTTLETLAGTECPVLLMA